MKKPSLLLLIILLSWNLAFTQENLIGNYSSEAYIFDRKADRLEYYGHITNLTENEFLSSVDSLYKERLDLLDLYAINDQEFIQVEKQNILLKKLKVLLSFETAKKYIAKNPDFELSKEFPDIFSQVELNNLRYFKELENYKFIVSQYYTKIATQTTNSFTLSFLRALSNDTILPEIREELIYDFSKQHMQSSDSIEVFYSLYKRIAINKKYKKEISDLYTKLKKVSKGEQSPDFKFNDINGNEVKISDFRGQYVYIDIWATWCKPCIIEMESLKKLKEESPHIIYISICKNSLQSRWINFVQNNNLKGIQLFAPDKNDKFFETYLIQAVPHFILIDKEGRILNPKGPKPSSKSTNELLRSLE